MPPTNTHIAEQRKSALAKFFKNHKRMPSFEEMREVFKVASKNAVAKIVDRFEEMGLVERGPSGRLVPGVGLRGVRMLGSIAAGFPTHTEAEDLDAVDLADMLIKNPEATYLLTVSGDSMIDAGIRPGDMVVVDRAAQPKNGDIVVAEVDHEWTLKYFERIAAGREIRLVPANKNYKPIVPAADLKIGGVVNAVIRKYK